MIIIDRDGEVTEETQGKSGEICPNHPEAERSDIGGILDQTRLDIVPVGHGKNRDPMPGRDFDPERFDIGSRTPNQPPIGRA